MTDALQASLFEERAENLDRQQLLEWTAEFPKHDYIMSRLKGQGAKLLVGPRGSGKSTLLLRAYYELIDAASVLAIYVNYSDSMRLEPLVHDHANALQLFRQSVLMRLVLGVQQALVDMSVQPSSDDAALFRRARQTISTLEAGGELPGSERPLGVSDTRQWLEDMAKRLGRNRVVVLMDDAAHAFSSDQQREFFEVFRQLRSAAVAPKAAVYPGITSYSPTFHVGHEAEKIEAWLDPRDGDYLDTMFAVVERRFPEGVVSDLRAKRELVDFLSLACFGMPRGLLRMLSDVLEMDESDGEVEYKTPTRARATAAVDDYLVTVRDVHRSLSRKLSRFSNFVSIGEELEAATLAKLSSYNRGKEASKKTSVVGYRGPFDEKTDRLVGFLEYAGIVRFVGDISKGQKGNYRRYAVHYGLVIGANGLSLGKTYHIRTVVKSLSKYDSHEFVKVQLSTLLGSDYLDKCTISLPPCEHCGESRLSDDALFCMRCGARLSQASVYRELASASVDELPITPAKIRGLRENADIHTVEEVLADIDMARIRAIPRVGPVWASRIRTAAEEYLSV